MANLRLSFIISTLLVNGAFSYKPVVFMHGILAAGNEADVIFAWIQEEHAGTETYSINMYENLASTKNMMEQQQEINKVAEKYMQQHPEGIHLICCSQGGLLCRGILEETKHNVNTFIALSSPLAGQFGMTSFDIFFPNQTRDEVYKIAYTEIGQKALSVCGYWNDPKHQTLYRKFNKYLAFLNNDTYNAECEEWRANFLRLQKLVLIGGPHDGVITPWQSGHFGFYNDKLEVEDMTKQPFYIYDTFGLQTMVKRNAVQVHTVPGVLHKYWYRTRGVFNDFIVPYLT